MQIDGHKQPLCKDCVYAVRQQQVNLGVPVWPEPTPDAYEGCREEEVDTYINPDINMEMNN